MKSPKPSEMLEQSDALLAADVIKKNLDEMMDLNGCRGVPEVVSLLREAKEKISEATRNISLNINL